MASFLVKIYCRNYTALFRSLNHALVSVIVKFSYLVDPDFNWYKFVKFTCSHVILVATLSAESGIDISPLIRLDVYLKHSANI